MSGHPYPVCRAVADSGEACVEARGHFGGHVSAADEYGMAVGWGIPPMIDPVESACPALGCNVVTTHERGTQPSIHNEGGSHTLVASAQ